MQFLAIFNKRCFERSSQTRRLHAQRRRPEAAERAEAQRLVGITPRLREGDYSDDRIATCDLRCPFNYKYKADARKHLTSDPASGSALLPAPNLGPREFAAAVMQ